MSMFFDVLNAINDPNKQGNVEQLGSLVNSVQQMSASTGVDPATIQTALSTVSGFLKPAMQQQAGAAGALGGLGNLGGLGDLMGQMTGGGSMAAGGGVPNLSNLTALIPPQMQQQIAQAVAQRTGLDPNMVMTMLPGLISTVMGFLNMGASKSGVPGGSGGNPLLTAFLDSGNDGVDMGDVMRLAGRFMNAPR